MKKSKSKSSRVADRYGMIEPLEPRIAPAAVTPVLATTDALPPNPTFVTVTAGGSLLVKAGEVLTTGSGSGGIYLLYVQAGQVLVHTTDLNGNNQVDFNEITGLSAGNGARIVSFVDIHGPIVTDLNPDGSLSDGGKGDVLLDNNIAAIDMRSLDIGDFVATATQTTADLVNAHLAMSSYSIFGNIYAGGGLGLPNDSASGLQLNNAGTTLQMAKYTSALGNAYYQATQPIVGSIYVGSSASGQSFSFGASNSATDVVGNLLAFNPAPGEAGAGIYNISSTGEAFSIGTIHAGNGGFNAPGGSIVNVALQGDNAGVYQLIAGNAGNGTTGQNGGSIVNFSEVGAILGEVVLQSGTGGTGLTGMGGNAGAINFNPAIPVEINAHFIINYGSGGAGYAGGGAGGGTTSGTFVTPSGQLTTALDVVSTMHTIGSIGSTQPFDFNGDGYSDMVFSTTNPNQVVVALGNGAGFKSDHFIYLNSPAQVDSIVVANFTGAVNPVTHQPEEDIAVASGAGSFAGIEVYLSQYNPKTGAFEGFSDPLFSPLPSLTGFSGSSGYSYTYTSTVITKLVAGDFTGNGVLGLAVLADETTGVSVTVDPVLIFLNGETTAAHPGGTGYFYANFSNNNVPFINLADVASTTPGTIMEATALTAFAPTVPGAATSNGHDVIIEAALSAKTFNIISDASRTPGVTTGGTFGIVDTNRVPNAPYLPTYTDFLTMGLTVTQDQNNPNVADVLAFSVPVSVAADQATVSFLATFRGNGAGGFTLESGTDVPLAGIDLHIAGQAIVTVPDASGVYSDVAVLTLGGPSGAPPVETINLIVPSANLKTVAAGRVWDSISPFNGVSATVTFDAYYPQTADPLEYGFATANPLVNFPDFQGFGISLPDGGLTYTPFKDAGFFITAGNGGTSLSGPGGAGGSLGQSLTVTTSGGVTTGFGTLSFQFPTDVTYQGVVSITAGNGGNGFTNGGAGGALSGISITYATGTTELTGSADLTAGKGGESLTATGGAGGSLSQLFIISGENFTAGNGGIGVIGGAAGSIYGNTQPGLITAETNSNTPTIVLQAGNGANGIDGGGAGGGIYSFLNEFPQLIGGVGGLLSYTAGSGGTAVAGRGGAGGSVVDDSPFSESNFLAGDIYLQGGAGGSGLYGGGGGSVTNFAQLETGPAIPTSSTIIAGAGGNATIGTGGAGGDITNISVSAAGEGNVIDVSYNRMVAGPGGTSAGGSGGAGGAVSAVNTASVSGIAQNVVAAGAGGAGLLAGGAGGSVTSATVDAGSTSGKVVVIAGDGGSSSSSAPADSSSPEDVALSIGGVNGPGGAGGSIIDFAQPLSTNTHVDLIAGNGGATLNHGVAANNAAADNSGKGGSITNASIQGSIGNSDSGVAILSYNNPFTGVTSNGVVTGTTVQDFVNNYILGDLSAPINDSIGNVGLVAGAAGFVEGGTPGTLVPSANGVNGSVSNVHAENVMSMVAGSVDQVSLIQSLTDYGVTVSGGILGANKTAYYNPETETVEMIGVLGQLNYISVTGELVPTPLPGGGELIDGAFVAMNIRTIESPRDFQGTEG